MCADACDPSMTPVSMIPLLAHADLPAPVVTALRRVDEVPAGRGRQRARLRAARALAQGTCLSWEEAAALVGLCQGLVAAFDPSRATTATTATAALCAA